MQTYRGKSVFGGIAIGKIRVFSKKEKQIERVKIKDTKKELIRYEQATNCALEQLALLYDKALKEVGTDHAAIFEIHQMMLEDEDYTDSVKNIITTQMVNAEYAIGMTADHFAQMFAAMEDEYMRARAADVRDISARLLAILEQNVNQNLDESLTNDSQKLDAQMQESLIQNSSELNSDEPVIILADDLAPSETVQMDKNKILAFVTVHGSVNSHTAILARTMGIPALVSTDMELTEELNGKKAMIDGFEGLLYIDPDEDTMQRLQKQKIQEDEQKKLLLALKGKEDVTIDGRKLMLYANIGDVKDLALVMQNDANGIGLFRSEFIFLDRKDYPTEQEQFQIYKTVAETMGSKRVIIRTLDIGADKKVDYFSLDEEENPALGYRAIRICLTQQEIFKTQLRAIFRASAYGNIAIMYPMIISVKEVRQIKQIVEEVKLELTREQIAFGEVLQGIMIETPAAVMMSDELAKEVDFFSIGTNDLTQYTLAIDRQNPKLDAFYDSHHPAILRMIRMVVQNAHQAGIWVGICGELGADTELTKEFLCMGVDELSVSPTQILPIRKIVRETDTRK